MVQLLNMLIKKTRVDQLKVKTNFKDPAAWVTKLARRLDDMIDPLSRHRNVVINSGLA